MTRGFAILMLLYACVVSDLKEGIVPNRVTIPTILIGILISFFENGFGGFYSSLNALFYSLLISLVLFHIGFIGGGDGKFFLAGASLCGFPNCFKIFFIAFIAGFLHTFFDALLEKRVMAFFLNFFRFLTGKKKDGEFVPFSPSIGIGILCTWGLK